MLNQSMTVGEFLGSAEGLLKSRGGYSAIADCTARVVRLERTLPSGEAEAISQAPFANGVAGEDIATDLLNAQSDSEELRFAREVYFPITFI
jgi:hypothetical protein